MKETELKPCPFCGGKAEIYKYDPYDGYQGDCSLYRVHCTKCDASFERIRKEQAEDAWNRRADNEQREAD